MLTFSLKYEWAGLNARCSLSLHLGFATDDIGPRAFNYGYGHRARSSQFDLDVMLIGPYIHNHTFVHTRNTHAVQTNKQLTFAECKHNLYQTFHYTYIAFVTERQPIGWTNDRHHHHHGHGPKSTEYNNSNRNSTDDDDDDSNHPQSDSPHPPTRTKSPNPSTRDQRPNAAAIPQRPLRRPQAAYGGPLLRHAAPAHRTARMSLLGKPLSYNRGGATRRDARYRRYQSRIYNFLERPRGIPAIMYHVVVWV